MKRAEVLRVRRYRRHPQRPPLCGQSVVWWWTVLYGRVW